MKKRLLFSIWGVGLFFYIQAQAITKQHFDSIWNLSHPTAVLLEKIDSLAMSIDPFGNDLPLKQIQQALALSKSENLQQQEEKLLLSLGSIYSYIDIQDSAKIYLDAAFKSFKGATGSPELARTYRELSWLYTFIPAYDQALEYGYQALQAYGALGDEEQVALMNSRIGLILEKTGQYEKAFPHLLLAAKKFQKYNNPKAQGYTYLRLAEYYKYKKDTVQAERAFDQYITKMSELRSASRGYLSGAYTRRGIFYRENKRFTEAEHDLLMAIEMATLLNDTLSNLVSEYQLGCLYAEMQQHEKAVNLLTKTIQDVNQYTQKNKDFYLDLDFQDMYLAVGKAYAKLGRYKEAYAFLEQQGVLKDSLFTAETNRTMLDMQTKYETEKKEVLLSQKQQQLYLSLGSLALLSLMAFGLYRANRSKQRQNILLEKGNEEKAFLIKEIHHRVKNNLQVLSSLLSLQSEYIDDPNALDAVIEGRNRVQSMGLIHQKLYMGNNLAGVEMKAYIMDLGNHLLASFGLENQVKLRLDCHIPPLDVDTAIPLGLIINELMTNSLKYAFPNGSSGTINIRFWINEQKELCLILADDGRGEVAEAQKTASTSFGSSLIKILSKKLKGKIAVTIKQGYCTTIVFQRYALART